MRVWWLLSLLVLGAAFFLIQNPSHLQQVEEHVSKFSSLLGVGERRPQKEKVVVVVGGGLAGLSAAIEASRLGSRVVVFEKEARMGGNSAKASSGINAVGTVAQKLANIDDSTDLLIQDTIKSGDGFADEDLVKVLVDHSKAAVDFLISFGVKLDTLSQCGGHSRPRTLRAAAPKQGRAANIGFEIMAALIKQVESQKNIIVHTSTRVTELLVEGGSVIGVAYVNNQSEAKELRGADAVILTSGGYSADRKGLLATYAPHLSHLSTTNGPFATGDAIKMAEKIGAELHQLEKVQVHPTSFVDPKDPNAGTKFLAAEALRGVGGIMVNSHGKRFTNEIGRRDVTTKDIFTHCQKLKFKTKNAEGVEQEAEGPVIAYLIMNEKAVQDFGLTLLSFYQAKGFIITFANAKEFAEKNGIDENTLKTTLEEYNKNKEEGKDQFGKTLFPVSFSPDEKLYVSMITPAIHYTMGGLHINGKGQVMRKDGSIISGLYAAGEASSGIHGQNRLAGNSLLECVVFGRIAGIQATQQ